MLEVGRRKFITGLAVALAAPAVVKAEFLMPVRKIIVLDDFKHERYHFYYSNSRMQWVHKSHAIEGGWVKIEVRENQDGKSYEASMDGVNWTTHSNPPSVGELTC